jgi:hypothetical protein
METYIKVLEMHNKVVKERDDLRVKLNNIIENIDNVIYPQHPEAREWCGELNTYLRGYAYAVFSLSPEEMKELLN